MSTFKFGRKPRGHDSRIPHLSSLIASVVPITIPAVVDWTAGMPSDLGMMLNDQFGNCIAEGVVVGAGKVDRAYRARYDGPMVILTTASGKKLPVTPNHAVLTESGFARAKTIQQGDNLVSTSRPEIFPGAAVLRGKAHINQAPALVEEIFAALALSPSAIRKVVPIAVDFHGDEQCVDGNVDVVGSDRLLWREAFSALRQPDGQNKVGATRELQRLLTRTRAALLARLGSLTATLGDVGLGRYGAALRYAHAGVAQSYGLAHRSQLMPRALHGQFDAAAVHAGFKRQLLYRLASHVALNERVKDMSIAGPRSGAISSADRPDLRASALQPSAKCHFTDPALGRDLTDAFPGLVTTDRVVDIDFQQFHGHVYDLSTQSRFYSANGIIAHNCTCAAVYHSRQVDTFHTRGMATPPDGCVEELYERACGYVPGDPATDQGGTLQNVLAYWLKYGAPIGWPGGKKVDKLAAYYEVDVRNLDDIKRTIYECGSSYIGIAIPAWFANEINNGNVPQVWDVAPTLDNTIVDGHCVIQAASGGGSYEIASWGTWYGMTEAFFTQFCDEAYGPVSADWMEKTGKTPAGFTLAQWEQQMEPLKALR